MTVFSNPASSSREQAFAYTAAILDLLGERDPIATLKATPRAVRRAIRGLGRRALRKPEAPGKWSIVQVIQHLADSDLVWGWRVRMILSHDRPPITGYDQDAWANRLGYAASKANEALEQFEVLRRSNLRVIQRASPEELQRVGVHEERGPESIAHLIRLYAGHDVLHRNQIARIRATIVD